MITSNSFVNDPRTLDSAIRAAGEAAQRTLVSILCDFEQCGNRGRLFGVRMDL